VSREIGCQIRIYDNSDLRLVRAMTPPSAANPVASAATIIAVNNHCVAAIPPATLPGPITHAAAQPSDASAIPDTRPAMAAVRIDDSGIARPAKYPIPMYRIHDPKLAQKYGMPVVRDAIDARASNATMAMMPIMKMRVRGVM